jgi:biofilm protein TabA
MAPPFAQNCGKVGAMIVDRLENYTRYFRTHDARLAFDFLLHLQPDTEDGTYPIRGDEIYARVMSYKTRPPAEGRLEAHREYIDIQTALAGAEGIDWVPLKGLGERVSYNQDKDVALYETPGMELSRVNVFPGTFALFLPEDAHMPQLIVGKESTQIKKAVIKIKVELLFSQLRRRKITRV